MPWPYINETAVVHRDPLVPQEMSMRQGDRLPAFAAQIEDEFGNPVNLTGLTVYMTARPMDARGELWIVNKQISIENAEQGIVSYDWQPEDTSGVPAEYEITLTVNDDAGTVPLDFITAPTDGARATIFLRPGVDLL